MGKRSKGHNAQKTSSVSNQPAAGSASRPQQSHTAPNNCYPLHKLCRLCLLSNATMEPIFAYPGDITLSQRIFQCTNLEIHENEDDGIPSSICSQCKRQLDQCHEFRLLCWKNNEVLQNLHTLLSSPTPTVRKECATPLPFVQVEKLDISSGMLPQNSSPGRTNTPKEFDTIALNRLYTPRSRGRKSGVLDKASGFTRELVIRLVPISPSFIKKYKNAVASPAATKHITQTKAAVKSYAQTAAKKSRKPFPTLKVVFKPPKQQSSTVTKSKTKRADKTKRPEKVKGTEIAVPPKKRKQNFEESTVAAAIVACTLCTQTFSNQKNLARHMATHENNRKQSRVFNCDVCKKEYLKASQLTDHLRSAEHIRNAALETPEDPVESILPDESEATATPADIPSAAGKESQDHSTETAQPLPDTNDLYEQIESLNSHFAQDDPIVIPIDDSDSSTSSSLGHGVQYSEVCSTNDSEALFNSLKENSHRAMRRVSFANATEIVD